MAYGQVFPTQHIIRRVQYQHNASLGMILVREISFQRIGWEIKGILVSHIFQNLPETLFDPILTPVRQESDINQGKLHINIQINFKSAQC